MEICTTLRHVDDSFIKAIYELHITYSWQLRIVSLVVYNLTIQRILNVYYSSLKIFKIRKLK